MVIVVLVAYFSALLSPLAEGWPLGARQQSSDVGFHPVTIQGVWFSELVDPELGGCWFAALGLKVVPLPESVRVCVLSHEEVIFERVDLADSCQVAALEFAVEFDFVFVFQSYDGVDEGFHLERLGS